MQIDPNRAQKTLAGLAIGKIWTKLGYLNQTGTAPTQANHEDQRASLNWTNWSLLRSGLPY